MAGTGRDYSISEKGVENLRKLATDVSTINGEIEASGTKLSTTVNGLSDQLGVYADQILELINSVNTTQAKGRESMEILTTKVNKLAEDVEALLHAGL